jgi:cell division transport system permease protein
MAIKIDYAIQESVTNMRRNLFMTFAAVLVVSLSLFLFGGVFLLRNAIARTADLFTAQVRVTMFLSGDISNDEREALFEEVNAMPEVSNADYETKQEAYQRFKELFADQPALIENTSPQALPESFRIELTDPRTFEVIRDRFDGRPGVQEIRDERETVKALFSVADSLRKGGFVMSLVVGVAATVLIATTIRMAIYARRREIGIMKLVGATNWFIRIPFMMEGVVQGVFGAVIAALLLIPAKPALSSFGPQFQAFRFRVTYPDILQQGIWLLAAGIFVGALGSIVGLRKFLDV